MKIPRWKKLTEEIAIGLFDAAAHILDPSTSEVPNLAIPAQLAVFHLNACLNASILATAQAQPSVSLCMLRQCVESLTLIDLGLQKPQVRDPLMQSWREGKETVGGLRRHLASSVWSGYGNGLWDENWEEYFSSLARAVHPYAHYSPELMEWQRGIISFDGTNRFIASTAHHNPDHLKATRLALLQSLVIWTLGRLLIANNKEARVKFQSRTIELGKAIASSDLLFKSKNWADELLPHVHFKPGQQWTGNWLFIETPS